MKKTISIIAILVLFMALPAWADMTLNIKLNFFGPAAGGKSGPGDRGHPGLRGRYRLQFHPVDQSVPFQPAHRDQ